ncbi:hypothetical protein [Methyloceanibacter stevinii]|uniref:hypothetical protein n=1 Tax=Methyloceanibacter stevinii TaxID=1774970 RepID=UPI0013018F81|nr:hypothetical protein [Methyloceanibacter stevinii]
MKGGSYVKDKETGKLRRVAQTAPREAMKPVSAATETTEAKAKRPAASDTKGK